MKQIHFRRGLSLLVAAGLSMALTAVVTPSGAQFQYSESGASTEGQVSVAAQTGTALPAAVLAQIDVVAAKMKESIQSHHFSKVLVLGAKGPDKKYLQLGMTVGDAFSASLEKQATGFQVATRDAIRDFLSGLDANMEEALTDDWKDGICERLGADAFVLVRFDKIRVQKATTSAFLFTASTGPSRSLAGWKFEFPLTDDALRIASETAVPKRAVEKGITNPECDYCPRPDFSGTEKNPKVKEATIYIWVLVGADGTASESTLMSSSYPKFDAAALKIIKTWRFKPAKDSKGEPVAQHVQVVVTYERF